MAAFSEMWVVVLNPGLLGVAELVEVEG